MLKSPSRNHVLPLYVQHTDERQVYNIHHNAAGQPLSLSHNPMDGQKAFTHWDLLSIQILI